MNDSALHRKPVNRFFRHKLFKLDNIHVLLGPGKLPQKKTMVFFCGNLPGPNKTWILSSLNNLCLKNRLTGFLWSAESFIVNERFGMFPIEGHHTLTKKGIALYVAQQGGTERPVSQHDLQVVVHHTLDCISAAALMQSSV